MDPVEEKPVPPRPSRGAAFFATGLALAFLWAASRAGASIPFAPVSIAERVIRLTPGDAATFFIDTLGHRALVLLTTGAVVAFIVAGTLLPRVVGPKRPRPYTTGASFGFLTLAASFAAPIPPSILPTVLVSVVAALLYGVCFEWLAGRLQPGEGLADEGRRAALAWVAAAALGFVAAGTVLGRVARRLAGPNTDVLIRVADVPAAMPGRASFPNIAGLSPEVTTVEDHYVVDIDLVDPVVEADGWTFEVRGLVEHPFALTFLDLQRDFELVEQYSVLTCISNTVGGPLVGSSRWMGVRLSDVLDRAAVSEDAIDIVFRCADGYSSSIPLADARDPTALLAIAHDGGPLRQEHGFPCRLRAPAFYGVKNAKWLEGIEVVGTDFSDYWTDRGWSESAVVRTQSRIDVPRARVVVGEALWVAGAAWAGIRGISQVEVSLDGGQKWQRTQLNEPLSPVAWTQWAYRWTPPGPGTYRLMCRATDGTGTVQESTVRRPHPSGASGYDMTEVEAV